MVKGCTNSCIKYILFFSNFLFVTIGLFIFGSGIYLLVKSRSLNEIISTPDIGSGIIIISGFSVFLVAFLGCCGAVQESRCMLVTYGVIVGLLSILQIAAAIFFLVYTAKLTDIARNQTKTAMHQYENWNNSRDKNGDEKKMAVDMLQWNLGCCGLNGPQDWHNFAPSMFRGTDVPNSCCFDPMIGATAICSLNGVTTPFNKGCADAIEDTFRVYIGVIAGVTIGISVIQLIAACFACMLSNALYN